MRIAFIDFVLDPARPGASGLSDVVWNMARELAKLGDDVHVIGPYTVEPATFDGITVHRFTLPPIGYRNIAGHILIVLAAWRVARRIAGLDAIHAPDYLTTGIIAPFSRVPVLLTTPGNIYERLAHGNPFDPITTQVYKLAARSSARWCALIDAISHDMGVWWAKTGARKDNVIVLPYGLDLRLFRPRRSRSTAADGEALRLLYVGRFSREKNVSLLPGIMDELRRLEIGVHLDVVGQGPLEAQLRAEVAELSLENHVTFHHWMTPDELVQMYSRADLLLVPSHSEPLGRVVMEAMACGTPVIGTRVGGIVDLINDGENGFLIEPDDVIKLIELIKQLNANRAVLTRLSDAAQSHAHERWDWSTVTRTFRRAVVSRIPELSDSPTTIGEMGHA